MKHHYTPPADRNTERLHRATICRLQALEADARVYADEVSDGTLASMPCAGVFLRLAEEIRRELDAREGE